VQKGSVDFEDQITESDMQIPRFALLKNDDDCDRDNKALMPMQDNDFPPTFAGYHILQNRVLGVHTQACR